MTIQELYLANREFIKDGDLILFHGTSLLSKIIQNCDKAYWNHIGVVFEANGALYIEDSNGNGVQADRLSYRIDKYKPNGEFCLLRPICEESELKEALKNLLNRPDKKNIKYDFKNGAKELFNRKFKANLNISLDDDRDICSDFVSNYAKELKMMDETFLSKKIVFPEDYLRYRVFNKCKFIRF